MSRHDTENYCKHGVYVGGCGADYMCGPCEMGDPDPTISEMFDDVGRLLEERNFLIVTCRENGLDPRDGILERNTQAIWKVNRDIAEANRWSLSIHDSSWMDRRRRAMLADEADRDAAFSEAATEIIKGAVEFMDSISR